MTDFFKKNKKIILWCLAIIYVCILFGMQFIRIFDNNFWGDEAFSIVIVRKSLFKMIKFTAEDVHPPLYYMILMLGERLLPGTSWVYHLVTVIGYGLLMVAGLTVIRKQLGNIPALIFITMASMLDCTVYLNQEVRMYTWAGLFVVMAFYFYREVITTGKNRNYVGFVTFSLMAAYTHYYALVTVACFYVMLLIWFIWNKDKVGIRKTLISYLVTVLVYMPWFIVLIMTFLRTLDDYWMTYIPTLTGSLRFLFEFTGLGLDLSKELEIFFGITVIYVLVYYFKKKELVELFWTLTGCVSVGGTIFAGEFISHVFRPMYLERYLYPAALVGWIVFGTNITKIKYSKIITAVLVAIFLVVGVDSYVDNYNYEMAESKIVNDSYAKLAVEEGDEILSDELGLTQAVLLYYYPKSLRTFIELDSLPQLETDREYWLFLSHTDINQYADWLSENGYKFEEIYMNANLGSEKFNGYKLVKVQ